MDTNDQLMTQNFLRIDRTEDQQNESSSLENQPTETV